MEERKICYFLNENVYNLELSYELMSRIYYETTNVGGEGMIGRKENMLFLNENI